MAEALDLSHGFVRTCPLGVRYWDVVAGQAVTDGLEATAWPDGHPEQAVKAVATPGGRQAFHSLRGLQRRLPGPPPVQIVDLERHPGTPEDWANLPDPTIPGSPPRLGRQYEVLATHLHGDFLPCRLRVTAPVQGELTWPAWPVLSPPGGVTPWVPLYSSVRRPFGASTARVRAELYDGDLRRPASWALLEVSFGGVPLARGLADEEGRVCVAFARPRPPALANPPVLSARTWTLDFAVRYGRLPRDPVPLLDDIESQPFARLLRTLGAPQLLDQGTLRFGEELVLQSNDPPPPANPSDPWVRSVLFVAP